MTNEHALTLTLGNADDLAWAQATVTTHHYLRAPVDPRARPMCYWIKLDYPPYVERMGLVILGIPHATRCRGWWGYEGTPTQWQVVDLSRIFLFPIVQAGGELCQPGVVPGYTDRRGVWRPTVATWAIAEVLRRVQADRVRLWPRSTQASRIISAWRFPTVTPSSTVALFTSRPTLRPCTRTAADSPCPDHRANTAGPGGCLSRDGGGRSWTTSDRAPCGWSIDNHRY